MTAAAHEHERSQKSIAGKSQPGMLAVYLAALVQLQVNDVLDLVGAGLSGEGCLNVLVDIRVQCIDLRCHVRCLASSSCTCAQRKPC